MGRPMAKNLLKAEYQLGVYSRTRAKAEELAKQGALVVDSPWQAVQPGGILITSLANGEAVESATEAVLEHLGPKWRPYLHQYDFTAHRSAACQFTASFT